MIPLELFDLIKVIGFIALPIIVLMIYVWQAIIWNLRQLRQEAKKQTDLLARIAEKSGVDVDTIKAIYRDNPSKK